MAGLPFFLVEGFRTNAPGRFSWRLRSGVPTGDSWDDDFTAYSYDDRTRVRKYQTGEAGNYELSPRFRF